MRIHISIEPIEFSDYKQEKIITNRLTRSEILDIHYSADCYVNTSYGEAWCYPCFDAWAVGNSVISNCEGGPRSYLCGGQDNVLLISNRKEPVFGMNDTFQNINTSREYWHSIDILELGQAMRVMYENRKVINNTLYNKYSYESIGKQMVDALSKC